MSSAKTQLSALVSLIAEATKTVEALVEKSGNAPFPTLDDTTPHPLDTEISSIEMKRAVSVIEGACAQLCATVARPNHSVVNKLMGIYEPACLHVACSFKIPDILQEKPSGMHISEIAEKSGVEVGKLGRIMRLLATKHVFQEVSSDVFANNRLSLQLLSDNPVYSLSFHFTDENTKGGALLVDTLADPKWGHSYAPELTPFNKWTKSDLRLFSYYDSDIPGARQQAALFGIGMMGWNTTIDAAAVAQEFPWGELGEGATVCDVGGGVGTMCMKLAKAHPNLLLKLQDRPNRIHQAQTSVWPAQCPEAIEQNRIEFKPIDFMTESPIKGCDVYYLKNVIHDWPEKESVKILSGVRAAMGPHSRILIQEYIIQHANRVIDEETDHSQAPEPLLPNYGVGRIRPYNLDLAMMIMANATERRLEQFVKLGNEAGLKFVKLWDFHEMGLVEFRLP